MRKFSLTCMNTYCIRLNYYDDDDNCFTDYTYRNGHTYRVLAGLLHS